MLSPGGYDLAWTQYQGFLVDQLNRMTACTIPPLPQLQGLVSLIQ